jgi:Domain of unknown function (DUF4249)
MHYFRFLLPFTALFLTTCSNDFDLTDDWKEIPVVWGMLTARDTAQYIRIEKAFLSETQGAPEVAQNPDSLYFPDNAISVFLQRINTGTRYPMVRVDGNLERYQRDTGFFADRPNWLYKLKFPANDSLRAGERYRLIIERRDNKPAITGETTIPGNFTLISPNMNDVVPLLSINNLPSDNVTWRCDVNALYFDVYLALRYREVNASTGAVLSRSTLTWRALKGIKRDPTPTSGGIYRGGEVISLNNFANFLSQNLRRFNGQDTLRFFENVDIILEGGGQEVEPYLEALSIASGITGAETIVNYTNLSEGFGLFTAKNRARFGGIRLTPLTIDSLSKRPETRNLNFR